MLLSHRSFAAADVRGVPAAQYIRMSSDGQDLSPALQRNAISEYARDHGMRIVETYEDPGRSGLTIRSRPSMRRLIQDVASGKCPFAVILVYDVSRWGRFFDTDESAYYEFHCRLHGVQVHYVSEAFSSELNLATQMLKNMKRVMAAEYSRELGAKCRAGQGRVVELGYQMGLLPSLGFRRVAVAADGTRKRSLEPGERKPALTDRVRWVFGPEHEVELVRTIFHLYAATKLSMQRIADVLNSQGHVTARGGQFTEAGIGTLLGCEAYIGNFVWGRNAHSARGRRRADTDPQLSRKCAVLPAMVDRETWDRAKRKREDPTGCRLSDSEVLESLRSALRRRPNLQEKDLRACGCQSAASYRRRFGSFLAAAQLAAADRGKRLLEVRERMRTTRALVERFIVDLIELLKEAGLCAIKLPHQCAILLQARTRVVVQFLWRKDVSGRPRWQIKKRKCGACQYVLFVRMLDDARAADFVLVSATEYGTCSWSLEAVPSWGIRCRSGQELVETLRLDCTGVEVFPLG